MRSHRLTLVTGVALAVFIVLALLVINTYTTKLLTIPAWLVTHPVAAGQLITHDNVRLARVGTAGEHFDAYTGDPRDHLASHDLAISDIIRESDLILEQIAEIPVNLRYAPALRPGDSIDIYAALTSGGAQPDPATARLVLVGRSVTVASATTAASGNGSAQVTIHVPTRHEARWMALQSGNVLLVAARSKGIGVEAPPLSGMTVADALSGLTGTSIPGGFLTNPSPSPSPRR